MVLSAKLSVQVIRSLILLPANVEKSQEAQAWNYVNQKKQVIFAASNHMFDPLQTLFNEFNIYLRIFQKNSVHVCL